MASVRDFDSLRRTLRQFGQSEAGPEDKASQIEELTRRLANLEDVVDEAFQHLREGPDWSRSFLLHAKDVDAAGVITVSHGLDFTPNAYVVVRHTVARGKGASTQESWGTIRLTQATASEVTFQFDKWAKGGADGDDDYGAQAAFRVCLFLRGATAPMKMGGGI
jgi:hypothetical protein